MKIFFLIATFIVFSTTTIAQQNRARDSLVRLLPKANKDSNLVQLYFDIGYEYSMNDYEKAIAYYNQAKKLSEELGYTKGRILYTSYFGNILKIKGEYDSALQMDKMAIRLAKEIDDNIQIAKSYINAGNVFHYRKQHDSTLYYYETAKKYAGNDARLSARIANLMVSAYLDLGRKQEAIAQGEKALAYFRKANEPSILGQVLLNLGSAYEASGNSIKARSLLHEALQIAREIGFDELRLHCLVSLMNDLLWHNKGADPLLLTYGQEAMSIAKQQQNTMGISLIYKALGNHYKFKRNYPLALNYLDSAFQVAQGNKLLYEQQEVIQSKGLLLTAMGKLEEGNLLLNESSRLKDSIVSSETREQVLRMEKSFEVEKKENQIKLQEAKIKQKNLLNSIFIGSTVSLIFIVLLVYRNYRNRQKIQKAKIEELETEKQLLAVQSLLKGQEDERSRLAKDLHDGLGGMLSGVKLQLGAMKGNMILKEDTVLQFNDALQKLDQSIAEMRRVAHNMMPEALIQLGLTQAIQDYCNNISHASNYTINTEFYGLDERLNPTTEITVYRIVQELVNNVVKHAKATQILIQIVRREQTLSITVEDNGQGFDASEWERKPTAGLHNILSRVHFLNGHMDIKSTIGQGTSVHIECNIEHHE